MRYPIPSFYRRGVQSLGRGIITNVRSSQELNISKSNFWTIQERTDGAHQVEELPKRFMRCPGLLCSTPTISIFPIDYFNWSASGPGNKLNKLYFRENILPLITLMILVSGPSFSPQWKTNSPCWWLSKNWRKGTVSRESIGRQMKIDRPHRCT